MFKKLMCLWVKIENEVLINMVVESDFDVLDLFFDKFVGILKSELLDIYILDFVSYYVIYLFVIFC